MTGPLVFPPLRARNLEGLEVALPGGFAGERNLVAIAFRRDHQALVDSWVPWFEARSASDPGLRFYELPTIGRIWAPVRNFIDGGMASSIKVPSILQRTLTVYGDLNRVAQPLGISDRSTITVLLLDASGTVRWRSTGARTDAIAGELDAVLAEVRDQP